MGKYLRHMPRVKHLRGSWLHRRLGDRLLHPELWQPERHRFAAGLALGAFFSMMPIPLQMLPAAFLAMMARINVPAAIVGCWISNPFTAPFFLWLQYRAGTAVLGAVGSLPEHATFWELVKSSPKPILLGAMIVGLALGALTYPLAGLCWSVFDRFVLRRRGAAVGKLAAKG